MPDTTISETGEALLAQQAQEPPRRLQLRTGAKPKSAPLTFHRVRELTEEDLVILASTRLGSTAPPLKRLKDSHHRVAQCLASGLSPAEVSAVTGYSPSRISILQADQIFGELLAFYRERAEEQFVDMIGRLQMLGLDALQELQYRLENDPDLMGNTTLIDLVKACLDRSGFGPESKSKSINANIFLDSGDIADVKKEVKELSVSTVKKVSRRGGTQTHSRPANSLPVRPALLLEAQETEGKER